MPTDPQKPRTPLLSAPKVSLPTGGGAIRGIGESFQANPVTGTASFSVPIAVSPGRAGFQPALALHYDSGSGNGPFGLGWHLDAPSIQRKTDRGLPQYQDAVDSDTFTLSGAEDLVPAQVRDGDARVDDTREEGPYRVRRYRPRVEGAWARIERWTRRADGDIHWRVWSKDNTAQTFGRSTDARLADPDDASRVFAWYLEEVQDERGNIARYEYQAEDRAGVDTGLPYERGRTLPGNQCATTYLKRVLYGNRVPGVASAFHFQVVFDYGDHHPVTPTPAPDRAWPERLDPFSSSRSGFDVRCARLCRRVLVFHSFPELGPAPVLVRATEITYQADTRLSKLTAIRSVGYRTDGGVRSEEALPPLRFTYNETELGGTVQLVQGLDDLPAGVDIRSYQWVDLDGEGAPGLLAEVGGAWWYKRNEGKARFGGSERLPERPSVGALGQSQLISLEGDGRLDLVTLRPGASGYQTRTTDGGWEPFRPFQTLPNVDWSDPNLRQLDLDGDGHPDVLLTEDDALTWYPSEAREGYGQARRVARSRDEASGPTLVFSSERETLFLADMTGDGLTDLVRIRNGHVCYWPNRGYGRFGARVVMVGAPVFDAPDQFDPKRIRLFDIDGSGPTDLVYLGREGVRIWSNHAGNRFGDATTVAGFGGVDDAATVSVADLLGEGTGCLVWSSPLLGQSWAPLRYLPLHASGKPHLLRTITNNLGGETRLSYASSTRYYLEDKRTGTPWATRLPFPVQVLERVEQRDHIQGWKFVQRYAYHHGYFDARDREFRGFGMVEQWDTESFSDFTDADATNADLAFHKDPVLTRSWFHTGAWRDGRTLTAAYKQEWYDGDVRAPALADPTLPAGLSVEEEQEAVRALKGQLLRQEVYAVDGSDVAEHPYTVTEQSYAVKQVQAPDDEGHGVFLVVPTETRTSHYERDPDDPRVGHTLVLEVDGYGFPTRTATVGYPRRAPEHDEQSTTAITVAESALIHQDDRTDAYHLGVPARAQTWELSGLSGDDSAPFTAAAINEAFSAAAEIPYEEAPDSVTVQRRCLNHTRTRYWRDDLSGPLPLGALGRRALVYQSEALVYTPGLLSAAGFTSVTAAMLRDEGGYSRDADGWWAPSGVQTLDPAAFYQPTALTDPWGNVTTIGYDAHGLFVTTVTDPIGNTTTAEIDYQALQPRRTTDANGDGSAVVLDALGRVTALCVFGNAGEGDLPADPTSRFAYYPNRWMEDGQPCAVYTASRERHADATSPWQEAWLYIDGHGHELMRKVPAAPGQAPARDADGKLIHDADGALVWRRADPRWVGTGRTVVDNKGNPVRQYEPFFAPTADYESDAEIVEWGVTPELDYDPLGRNVRTDLPNGSFRTVSFDPWRQSTADENDNVQDSAWYAARKDLPAVDPEARAARLTLEHADTPTVTHLDALGRAFLTVQDNAGDGSCETRLTLDIQGQTRAVTDGRGIVTQTQRFDLLGRVVHEGSPDAGDTRTLTDLAGNPIRVWKSGDLHLWRRYDALRRPTHLIVEEGGARKVAERLIYGELHLDPAPLHLRGRLYRHYDGAGARTVDSYDFKGNLSQESRALAASLPVDWSDLDRASDLAGIEILAAPLLESAGYTTQQTWDALNRPVTRTTPDGSVTSTGYDAGGRLDTMSAALRGAATSTSFVEGIQYDAKGQRTKITYGNGVVTRYTYEADTFRLSRLTSVRRSDRVKLQDLLYSYDPVGNITEVRDRAQDTLYFDNAQVSPRAWYTYDALYRLKTARGRERATLGMPGASDPTMGVMPDARTAVWGYRQRYTYDAVGNIEEMKHKADNPSGNWTRSYAYATDSNRLLTTTEVGGTVSYAHNDRGAMVNLPHLYQDGLGSDNVTVDHNDQMIGAQLNASDTAEYAYDGAGQRVFKRVTKGANVETRVYLGGYEVWTRTVGGTTREVRETLHGMDGQRRVLMVETKTVERGADVADPVSRLRYQLGNHLGSACVEVDQDAALIGYEEYHPYGTTSWQAFDRSKEVSAKRYKYTGMERDEETGLQCHGVRYYAGWLGRWSSSDPMGLNDGPDRYSYVGNQPITASDLAGTEAHEVIPLDDHGISKVEVEVEVIGQSEQTFWSKALDVVQFALDIVGFVPGYGEPADLINAGISLARGNKAEAVLSLAAMIPVVGIAGTGGKWANKVRKAEHIVESSAEAIEATNHIARVEREAYDLSKVEKLTDEIPSPSVSASSADARIPKLGTPKSDIGSSTGTLTGRAFEPGSKTKGGLTFSKHGADTANERGFTENFIDEIVKNNKPRRTLREGEVRWEYVDKNGRKVVLGPDKNRIISVHDDTPGGKLEYRTYQPR